MNLTSLKLFLKINANYLDTVFRNNLRFLCEQHLKKDKHIVFTITLISYYKFI